MTLTFKTAKYAIDEHGGAFRTVRIVENFDDPTELSNGVVTRAEAEDISEYDPNFKPCVVVTTAREALEAAWELAHEPEDGIIPANSTHLRRNREDGRLFMSRVGSDIEATDSYSEHRCIDPPTPKPEPWELARYCYADGDIYKRFRDARGVYWMRPAYQLIYNSREDLAKLNPRPVTIEGEDE